MNIYRTAMLRFGRYIHAVIDDGEGGDILLCRMGRGPDLRPAPAEKEVDCDECLNRLRGNTRKRP